jgi:ubiquinone biosynthesis UbiH/UbiF/VisC/COQ6 family hydroxylase
MNEPAPVGPTCDLAICGGGMVGATLALALAPLDLSIVLIEAAAPDAAEPPSFDERTTALANGSARTYRALGVWRDMEREATPIRRIHVSEQGRFGVARIDASEEGMDALGYVISNRAIGAALWPAMGSQPRIRLFAPARVTDTSNEGGTRSLEIETGTGPMRLDARLVIAADGARSVLRERAGIPAEHWDYGQTAIVATLTTQRFHDHVAYERFTPHGPLAMLPLADGRCGLVWTRAPDESARLIALPDEAFLAELQEAFGLRLGRLLSVGPPSGVRACADARRAPHGAASCDRRQCGAGPAPDRRSGVQPGAARRREPRRSARRSARGRRDRSGQRSDPRCVCRMACRGSPPHCRIHRRAGASLRDAARLWCGTCAGSGSSPSMSCHRRRARYRA